MKKVFFLIALLYSYFGFSQNSMTTSELQAYETRLMPFDVRLKTSPFTIQTIQKNKFITAETLKEYIVAGSNLKFIAQDKPNTPVGSNTDARIIISENGNSISLRPRTYEPNMIPLAPTELYHTFASVAESITPYAYKGYQVFQKTDAFSSSINDVIVLSNFRDLVSVSGQYRYIDINQIEHTVNIDALSTEPKVSIDLSAKTVTIHPFYCYLCTNKQYEITVKYTKP